MSSRWPVAVALTIAGVLLFIPLVIVFIPSSALQGVLADALKKEGYVFQASDFGKAFPLGISARQLEITDERGALFKADEASLKLRLLPLLTGKAIFSYDAEIGKGMIRGEFSRQKGGELSFEVSRLRLEDIPFFATAANVTASGNLDAEGHLSGSGQNATGNVQLEVKGLNLAGVKISGIPLPEASYDVARGAMNVGRGKAVLESLVLQGEGIYARLTGDFPITTPLGVAPLHMTLEIMPKPDFLEKQKLVFLLLAKYMVSPGNYRIPVSGTLAHPAIL